MDPSIPAMAPTIAPSFPGSRGGQRAAAPTITISSGSDVSVRRPTVINVSSDDDDDEVTSQPRSAARRTTPPSSVSVVRSPRASSNRVGEARSQPRRAAPARPSSPASSGSGGSRSEATSSARPSSPASSGSGGSGSEATSRQPKKKNKWCLKDERLVLETMAFLRMCNKNDEVPKASEIWKHLVALNRRGVDVRQLSDKMSQLKSKFKKTAAKAAANGGKLRRRTRYRDEVLYEISQQVWPHLHEEAGL
ncbi:hypothetical protein C2845_PM15G00220 [Panicum miliaceum]|uniref:Glabrous enhancer-binding protein-like DBD domain-containing protein n=1 Tax=Panicum miliaceum TaxID=4540 RepID=A0A3L6Q4X9_PANMI|nr:hypothetical protein C2845_PM15G00220 [Panicum miliaceum]